MLRLCWHRIKKALLFHRRFLLLYLDFRLTNILGIQPASLNRIDPVLPPMNKSLLNIRKDVEIKGKT